jgi:predicted phosphodiesterase
VLDRSALMISPIALISDIHGNAPALRAVLDDIHQCACQQIFVLGDIINGIDPSQCVDLLLAQPRLTALKGNAEWYILTPDLAAFPLRNVPRYAEVFLLTQWWSTQLSRQQLAWLQSLPDLLVERGMALVHDSPFDRLYPERRAIRGIDPKYHEFCFHAPGISATIGDSDVQHLGTWMEAEQATELYCGHTHEPFHRSLGHWQLCNTGSVGMPLDGDPRASWVFVTEEPAGRRQITIRRVAYAVEETLGQIDRVADYPAFESPGRRAAYKQMLRTGIHWRVHLA